MLTGAVLISGLGDPEAYGANPWLGVASAFIGGFFYALFLLALRESNRGYFAPPQGPLLDATIGAFALSLLVGPLFISDFEFGLTAEQVGWVALMALSTQVVGWLLIAHALPRLPALQTSVILLLQPLFAAIWGILFFDERFSTLQWIGAILVLGGIAIINAKGAVEAEPATETRVA